MDKATLDAFRDGNLDILFDSDEADEMDAIQVPGQPALTLRAARFGRVNVWTDKDHEAMTGRAGVTIHVHETAEYAAECHRGWIDQGKAMVNILTRLKDDPALAMTMALAGAQNGGLTTELAQSVIADYDSRLKVSGVPAPVRMLAATDEVRTGMYL